MDKGLIPSDYKETLQLIKNKIIIAQQKAMLSVNKELLLLYWDIGNTILDRINNSGWGAKVIEKLSNDLKNDFPNVDGFSLRNLKYMRQFAQNYPNFQIGQVPLAQLPWYHSITLLEKVKDVAIREWYAKETIQNGWSRNVMLNQIKNNLYERSLQENKTHNFTSALPSPQSELAIQTLKDPYKFDFLALTKEYKEKELEDELVKHITNFLLELGAGFAFVGRQYPLEVSGSEYHLDLLFYHLKLKCYVVIELKADEFKPEFVGKLNFYLSAVDDLVKDKDDKPTIGILLCAEKDKIKAEYSLKDFNKPIGISEYDLTKAIPENLKSSLPTIEELETEIEEKLTEDEEDNKNGKN